MLPYSGRIDDNIDTDTDTVATDLHRTSSCVALALPLPFPYYHYYYYYYYYYPRVGIAASLLKSNRHTLIDDHEDDSSLLFVRIDEPQVKPTCFDLASTEPKAKEQQDEKEYDKVANVACPINDKKVIVFASENSNSVNRQNARARFSA